MIPGFDFNGKSTVLMWIYNTQSKTMLDEDEIPEQQSKDKFVSLVLISFEDMFYQVR